MKNEEEHDIFSPALEKEIKDIEQEDKGRVGGSTCEEDEVIIHWNDELGKHVAFPE